MKHNYPPMRHRYTSSEHREAAALAINLALERLSAAALHVRPTPTGRALELRLHIPTGYEGCRHDLFLAGPAKVAELAAFLNTRPRPSVDDETAIATEEAAQAHFPVHVAPRPARPIAE